MKIESPQPVEHQENAESQELSLTGNSSPATIISVAESDESPKDITTAKKREAPQQHKDDTDRSKRMKFDFEDVALLFCEVSPRRKPHKRLQSLIATEVARKHGIKISLKATTTISSRKDSKSVLVEFHNAEHKKMTLGLDKLVMGQRHLQLKNLATIAMAIIPAEVQLPVFNQFVREQIHLQRKYDKASTMMLKSRILGKRCDNTSAVVMLEFECSNCRDMALDLDGMPLLNSICHFGKLGGNFNTNISIQAKNKEKGDAFQTMDRMDEGSFAKHVECQVPPAKMHRLEAANIRPKQEMKELNSKQPQSTGDVECAENQESPEAGSSSPATISITEGNNETNDTPTKKREATQQQDNDDSDSLKQTKPNFEDVALLFCKVGIKRTGQQLKNFIAAEVAKAHGIEIFPKKITTIIRTKNVKTVLVEFQSFQHKEMALSVSGATMGKHNIGVKPLETIALAVIPAEVELATFNKFVREEIHVKKKFEGAETMMLNSRILGKRRDKSVVVLLQFECSNCRDMALDLDGTELLNSLCHFGKLGGNFNVNVNIEAKSKQPRNECQESDRKDKASVTKEIDCQVPLLKNVQLDSADVVLLQQKVKELESKLQLSNQEIMLLKAENESLRDEMEQMRMNHAMELGFAGVESQRVQPKNEDVDVKAQAD